MQVKNVDMAYTSPSTAENQIEEVNAVTNPATIPAPRAAIVWPLSSSVSRPASTSRARIVVDQQTNMPAKAVQSAESRLTE